jgi:hypothetical protein
VLAAHAAQLHKGIKIVMSAAFFMTVRSCSAREATTKVVPTCARLTSIRSRYIVYKGAPG